MSVEWETEDGKRRGPSWRELTDEAARLLGFDDPELLRMRGSDLQILEYFKLVHSGQTAKLSNWLVRTMNLPDAALENSPIHRELALFDNCKIIYTTNYDDFIERSLRLHRKKVSVIASESEMAPASDAYQIIKFHGDLDHPDAMVLSESDYERRLKLSDALDYRLRSDLLGRALLFIGYSFRDWNVSYLFRLVNDEFKGLPGSPTGRRAYIVVADPSIFERELFRDRNIEVIPVQRRNQTENTAALLQEMRG